MASKRPKTIADLDAKHAAERRDLVAKTLERHDWRLTRAAEALGVTASTMQELIKRNGLAEEYAKRKHAQGRPPASED